MTDDTEYDFGATEQYIDRASKRVIFLDPDTKERPFEVEVPPLPGLLELIDLVESADPEENVAGILNLIDDHLLQPDIPADSLPATVAIELAERMVAEMVDEDLAAAADELETEGN
jgi:hypothetical protein